MTLTNAIFKNPQDISIEDLQRPLMFIVESKKYSECFNSKTATHICKNKVSTLYEINITAIDEFLEICLLTSYTFHVSLFQITNGNLRKYQEYMQDDYKEVKHYSNEFPVIDVTIDQDFIRYDEFFAMLFKDVNISPFINHVKSDLNAIVSHCWKENVIQWRINLNAKTIIDEYNVYSVIQKLKNSGNRLIIRFPSIESMPRKICSPTNNSNLPILWLDVDGVINAVLRSSLFIQEFPDCKRQEIINYPIMWSPTVVSIINKWSQIAEIRWLTSWHHEARYILAPIIGLNDFEVCNFSKYDACFVENHKPQDLTRSLLWIDDEDVNENVKKIIKNEVLLVKPNCFLSQSDIAIIDAFLTKQKK